MKALILAAGYGTRLQSAVPDTPKALVTVGKKTILDYLIDQITGISDVDGIYLVTNSKFYNHFKDWQKSRPDVKIEILDDQTSSNEERLGAIGDLRLLIEHFDIKDDILVCAADTIVQPSLAPFVEAFRSQRGSRVCVRWIEDKEDIKRRGLAVFGADGRITEFVEKPANPTSNWAAMPFYIYPKEVLPRIAEYLDFGGLPDAPGYLIAWLYTRETVFAYNINGQVLDIGTPESLAKARKIYGHSS